MVLNERPQNSILQIIQIKEMTSKTASRKFRIALSDGDYYTSAILGSQLNPLIESNDLCQNTIIMLKEFTLTPTIDKQLLIAINVEPVMQYHSIIGNPNNVLSVSQQNSGIGSQIIRQQHQQHTEMSNSNSRPIPQEINNNSNSRQATQETNNSNNSNSRPVTQENVNQLANSTIPTEQSRIDSLNKPTSSVNQIPYSQHIDLISSSDQSQQIQPPPSNQDKNRESSQKVISNFFNATQNTARRHAYISIEMLNPYIISWTILARVVMKGTIFNYVGRDGRPGKLFSVTLKDRSDSEIRGTFFNDQVDINYPIIEQDKVYQVSGGLIKEKNPRFNSSPCDYEISFNSSTKFVPMPDDHSIGKLTYRFKKLADLPNIPPKTAVDIIGYVISVGEVQTINLKDNKTTEKRDIVICDDSNVKCDMTLWDKDAKDFPNDGGFIVAFKDAKLSDFKGRTLSSPSNIIIRPTFPEANEIQNWIIDSQSNDSFDFNKMVTVSNGGESTRSYIYLSQINDLELGTHEKPDYGIIFATLQDVMLNRKLYYAACPNPDCKYKGLTITNDQSYFCDRCQRIVESPVYRYMFSIKVQDFTGSTFMSFLGDDQIGSLFTGMTALEWHDETDALEENEVRQIVQQKFFMNLKLRCRIKTDQYGGKSSIKTNIFAAQSLDYAEGARFFANEINKYT